MNYSAIASMAFLKANWDLSGKDYLENFVPMVTECIRAADDDIISLRDIQQRMVDRFRLKIPQNVIFRILTKIKKAGAISSTDGILRRVSGKLPENDFRSRQQALLQQHDAVINKLVVFANDRFKQIWNTKQAEEALLSFITHHQLTGIGNLSNNPVVTSPGRQDQPSKLITASFLKELSETRVAEFEYLDNVIRGNMLANAIFAEDPGQIQRNFHKTYVYFDTAFLIHALGYAGHARQDPCTEILELLYETGANLSCFSQTCDEIRGVLAACERFIQRGRTSDARGPIIPSIEYFVMNNRTPSDIELLAMRLETNLERLRIKVLDKPPYVPAYLMAEKEFEEFLGAEMHTQSPERIRHDVDCVSGIVRLRKGEPRNFLEDCGAIFITSNPRLARSCATFFRSSEATSGIPPCLTDYTITNLLWLKRPTKAPDLPRKRIIADCYAAIQPSEDLWKRYLHEIDKLKSEGKVTEDEYLLLRYKLEAKTALMELTLGEEGTFTNGTVPEILQIVQSKLEERVRGELALEVERRQLAEHRASVVTASEETRRMTIKSRTQKISSLLIKLGGVCILGCLLLGAVASCMRAEEAAVPLYVKIPIILLELGFVFWSLISVYNGSTVLILLRRAEVKLVAWLERRFLHMAGFVD